MSVKSVAVTGYYGRDNVGDEILLSSLIDLITERYGDVEVFVLTSDVKRTEELHDVTAVTESNPIEWVKTSMRVDALIIGGGGLFANFDTSALPDINTDQHRAEQSDMGCRN